MTRASGTEWALGIEAGTRALLRDDSYDVPLRRLEADQRAATALLNHMQHSWLRWRNSNLYKYLELALPPAEPGGST